MKFSCCRLNLIQGQSEWESASDPEASQMDELREIERHSHVWRLPMTSSVHAAIFHVKDSSENLHSVRYVETKCTDFST